MEHAESIVYKPFPIVVYGNSILRKTCSEVSNDDQSCIDKITNLWNTLEFTGGVGLAAPQINISQRIFVVKSTMMYDQLNDNEKESFFDGDQGIEETFINANIVDISDLTDIDNEGCLSIPGLEEQVERPWSIEIEYFDKYFKHRKKQFSGYTARVIQHEFDHTIGKLYIDHLHPLKRRLIKGKLRKIQKREIVTKYPIEY